MGWKVGTRRGKKRKEINMGKWIRIEGLFKALVFLLYVRLRWRSNNKI